MKNILLLTLALIPVFTIAQNNEVKAKAIYLNAEDDYGKGNYQDCIIKLERVVGLLGTTKPRLEKLLTKSYFSLRDEAEAKKHLESYFEVASKTDIDYDEMKSISSSYKEMISEGAYNKINADFQRKAQAIIDDSEESRAWEIISYENTKPAYDYYLQKFPNGEYTYKAEKRIKLLDERQPLVEDYKKGLRGTIICGVGGIGSGAGLYFLSKKEEMSEAEGWIQGILVITTIGGGLGLSCMLPITVARKNELNAFDEKNKYHFSMKMEATGYGLASGIVMHF